MNQTWVKNKEVPCSLPSWDVWFELVSQQWALISNWIARSSVCLSGVITSLVRKMRYWLTYFWALCFSPLPPTIPHSSIPVFFFQSFARFFHFLPSASMPTGPLGVEVRSEATWLCHVAEREQPGNKGLPLFELCCSVPNFHLHPLPFSPSMKKTPAGILQWGACERPAARSSKV